MGQILEKGRKMLIAVSAVIICLFVAWKIVKYSNGPRILFLRILVTVLIAAMFLGLTYVPAIALLSQTLSLQTEVIGKDHIKYEIIPYKDACGTSDSLYIHSYEQEDIIYYEFFYLGEHGETLFGSRDSRDTSLVEDQIGTGYYTKGIEHRKRTLMELIFIIPPIRIFNPEDRVDYVIHVPKGSVFFGK